MEALFRSATTALQKQFSIIFPELHCGTTVRAPTTAVLGSGNMICSGLKVSWLGSKIAFLDTVMCGYRATRYFLQNRRILSYPKISRF